MLNWKMKRDMKGLNIGGLEEGMEFDSYEDMCAFLGTEPRGESARDGSELGSHHSEELFRIEVDANYENGKAYTRLYSLRMPIADTIINMSSEHYFCILGVLDLLLQQNIDSSMEASIGLVMGLYEDYQEFGNGNIYLEEPVKIEFGEGVPENGSRVIEYVGTVNNDTGNIDIVIHSRGKNILRTSLPIAGGENGITLQNIFRVPVNEIVYDSIEAAFERAKREWKEWKESNK